MWIEELSSGKFKCIERYTDYITGKTKKVSVTIEKNTRTTRKAAKESLARKISEKQSITPNAELTLKQLIELYNTHQSKTTKACSMAMSLKVASGVNLAATK